MVDLPPGFRVVQPGSAQQKPAPSIPDGFRVVQEAPRQPVDEYGNSLNLPIPGTPGVASLPEERVEYQPSSVPWLDPINAFGSKLAESVPIIGPSLAALGNNVDAAFASMVEGQPVTAQERAVITRAGQEANPISSGSGWAVGTVAPLAALGATQAGGSLLGMAGNLGQRMLTGSASGTAIAGADTLARGGSMEEAGQNALLGGAIGGGFPVVAKAAGMLANTARNAISAGASGIDNSASQQIKSVASGLFESSKASGVAVRPERYAAFTDDLAARVKASGLDQALHPDTTAALNNLLSRKGQPLSFTDLHIIRQIAQDASRSALARDGSKAGQIVDAIDDFVSSLRPADIVGGADPRAAAQALHEGINLWSRASKTATVEEALYRAQNVASGFENGVRVELRKLIQNHQTRRLFTPDELMLMEGVVRGSPGANIMKLVGKFGFGGGNAGNMLGGTIGTMGGLQAGGPVGGLIAAIGATGARKASEKMTANAANRVLDTVAAGAPVTGPSLPQAALMRLNAFNETPVNLPMAPAGVPLLLQR